MMLMRFMECIIYLQYRLDNYTALLELIWLKLQDLKLLLLVKEVMDQIQLIQITQSFQQSKYIKNTSKYHLS